MADHYADAEKLLAMADAQALSGVEAGKIDDDPMAVLSGIVGAAVTLLAAQVHATLAVADAVKGRPWW